jgi:hypothetical protein
MTIFMLNVRNVFLLLALSRQLETPVNPSQYLREWEESDSVAEYHLLTNGEATGRRQKRCDREKSLTMKRNTLSNDSKH